MTAGSITRPGKTVADVLGAPEPAPDIFIPTVGRNRRDIPFWLFENRDVSVAEQYGISFESELPPLRSLRTAWLLALFLGFTGADRFYLRKPFTGTLKLLTLGGAGAWWIIDLFRITRPHAADGARAPLTGTSRMRRGLRLASAALLAAVLGLATGAALPPVTAAANGAYSTVRSRLNPPPPPPAPEWVTVGDVTTGENAEITTLTGNLRLTYSFTGPAIVFLQPAAGPAVTAMSLSNGGTGTGGVTVPAGTYTVTVSATGTGWTLKAEEFRVPD